MDRQLIQAWIKSFLRSNATPPVVAYIIIEVSKLRHNGNMASMLPHFLFVT